MIREMFGDMPIILLVTVLFIGCTLEKQKEYTIEQDYYSSEHNTWVWCNGHIAARFTIHKDSVSCQKIKENRIKAEEWIDRIKNCN